MESIIDLNNNNNNNNNTFSPIYTTDTYTPSHMNHNFATSNDRQVDRHTDRRVAVTHRIETESIDWCVVHLDSCKTDANR